MKNEFSIWKNSTDIKSFHELTNDLTTDVLIIGGGIAGILIAYQLQQRSIDYTLIEKNRILSGITQNTTAKITAQHGLIYHKIEKKYGSSGAKLYYKANTLSLEKFAELSEIHSCDLERKDNYVYSTDLEAVLQKEAEVLQSADIPFEYVNDIEIPINVKGAIKFSNQAQFNPLKLLSSISENLNIYENTFAAKIKGNTVFTERGIIKAEKIVIATHFPVINRYGLYPLKLYQSRSYVIALKKAQKLNGMYIDENHKGLSFRNYNDYLLLGGGAHRTGKNGGKWKELRSTAKALYPDSTEEFHWAAQDCMSLDGIMYAGKYSLFTPDIYVASGFSKWGMTSAMTASRIIADLICKKDNEFTDFFSPSRNILTPQLFVNSYEALSNLLTFSTKRCTHLGCTLKWNKAEHSWDCPCHGSRFDTDGKIIDNPAQKELK